VKFVRVDNGEEVTFMDVDMATGVMTMQPNIDHELGVFGLKLQVYLEDYPEVIKEEAIITTVIGTDNCEFD